MNPREIAARLAELREAGEKLRRRPAEETLALLERVLDAWADPESPQRKVVEAELPRTTGFSPEVVREGLRVGLESWGGAALHELVERELGSPQQIDARSDARYAGFDTTAVLLAGSIPMPTLLAIVAPLVLRSPVLAKSASRDPVTARLVARSLAETDPELGRCAEVVAFPGNDEASLRALLGADCVVATGSDETIASVTARARKPRRVVSYGHRLSVAVLGREATRGAPLADAADRLALDVALWDQLGCLSPLAVYVMDSDPGAPDRVAEALADALAEIEGRLPRGQLEVAAAAAIAEQRAEAEIRAAGGARVALHASEGTLWTVVREEGAKPRPAPLHRFLRVHPVADSRALVGALRPLAPHLAAVAVEGAISELPSVPRVLAELGASRVCRAGELQRPPLGWRHDNRDVLLPLARRADPPAAF